MSEPSLPPPDDPDSTRKTMEDLVAEVFPELAPVPDGPPLFSDEIVQNILAGVRSEHERTEQWTLKANPAGSVTNPIAAALAGQPTPVVITRKSGEQVIGQLQLGHQAQQDRGTTDPSSPFMIPSLGASSRDSEPLTSLAGASKETDKSSDANPPLCLMASRWPRGYELRGVEVSNLIEGQSQTADFVMLTAHRITKGFELDFLPDEEPVVKADAASISLTVVPKGGNDV